MSIKLQKTALFRCLKGNKIQLQTNNNHCSIFDHNLGGNVLWSSIPQKIKFGESKFKNLSKLITSNNAEREGWTHHKKHLQQEIKRLHAEWSDVNRKDAILKALSSHDAVLQLWTEMVKLNFNGKAKLEMCTDNVRAISLWDESRIPTSKAIFFCWIATISI